jgi:hypothetical protein
MQRLPLTMTGTAVMGMTLILLFGGFLPTASAASPISFINPSLGEFRLCSDVRFAQTDDFGNFDREGCEQSCRSRYGVGPLPYVEEQGWGGGGGGYQPGYYLYASCIDSCNSQYWRDFDRKMENLKRNP